MKIQSIAKTKGAIILFVLLSLLIMPYSAVADTVSDLQRQKEAYALEAQKAREQSQKKSSEADYLKSKLNQLNAEIREAEYSLSITNGKISETNSLIDSLKKQITEQEDMLEKEKVTMNGIVSSWYMEGDSTSMINNIFSSSNLSEVITRQEYYESIKQQIEIRMEKIEELKKQLYEQKTLQDNNMAELSQHKNNQLLQKNTIEQQRNYQSYLLKSTTNTINELKQQEKNATQKAQEIQSKINRISATKRWGGDITSSNDSSWYYSQLWYPNLYLGPSPYTVAQYGCLITSLAMIAKYYGRNYDVPSAVAASSFNNGGYLVYTPIVSDGWSIPINWDRVDQELSTGHPVVVGVALGEDMGNSYGVSHFVVLKPYSQNGNTYQMHDPLGAGRGYDLSQVKAMRIIR
jgi:peptidoglycan hydrolase CwlO-like protein